MSSPAYEGRCTCSYVLYELLSEPMFVHCCHCSACQREGGGSYAVNALIETDRVRLTSGEVEVVDTPTNSGQGQRIARCPSCKVALWSHYAYAGIGDAVRFLRVGTLEDPGSVSPDIHIFTSSKQAWVRLDPAIPAVPEFYKASEYWPPASLERRAALFEANAQSK
jgi:hypothetical protein